MTIIKIGPINPETGEKTPIYIEQIEIPDLWHIAQDLKATGAKVHIMQDGELAEKLAGDFILDLWHLAHDMKRFIQEPGRVNERPILERDNFGHCSWSVDDLQTRRPSWKEEKCLVWLGHYEGSLQDDAVERGWDTIDALLGLDDDCKGCGVPLVGRTFEEQTKRGDKQLCQPCEDDTEITVCIECEHVMRREHLDDDTCQNCS